MSHAFERVDNYFAVHGGIPGVLITREDAWNVVYQAWEGSRLLSTSVKASYMDSEPDAEQKAREHAARLQKKLSE